MPALCLELFLIISLSFSEVHLHVINVTEENELEQFMCYNDPPVMEDTLVVLSTGSITHYISGNESICMINATYSLTITSDSSLPAVINCNQTGNNFHWPTTGFSFFNVHNLTLQRLVFIGCGGFFKNSTIIDTINSTNQSFYFTQYQSAVLLFPFSNILLIDNVNITSYYGFAILAINPMNARMNSLTIRSSVSVKGKNYINLGSGVFVYYFDYNNNSTHTTMITNMLATCNICYKLNKTCSSYDTQQVTTGTSQLPIDNANSLTILYSQTHFKAYFVIRKTKFFNNSGLKSGAMFVLHFKSDFGFTVLDQVEFISNIVLYHKCHGSSLSLLFVNVLKLLNVMVSDSLFDGYPSTNPFMERSFLTGAVFIGAYNSSKSMQIIFRNSVFRNNCILTTGSCIYAISTGSQGLFKPVHVFLHNITAHNNFQTNAPVGIAKAGLFALTNINLSISDGKYYRNLGSVFDVTGVTIELSKNVVFFENKGEIGPAFKVHGKSYFLLSNGLNATFINNAALSKGGAIFAYDNIDYHECMFQLCSNSTTDIRMTFINNKATEAGSSIYSSNLYDCSTNGIARSNQDLNQLYKKIFNATSLAPHNIISLPPDSLCLCNISSKICNQNADLSNILTYPGQTIKLWLAAEESYTHTNQYAVVSFIIIDRKSPFSVPSWQVSANSATQALLEKHDCTSTPISLLKNENESNPLSPAVIVSSSSIPSKLMLHGIQLLDCPIGFELNVTEGKCVCSRALYKLHKSYSSYQPDCQISSESDNSIPTITRINSEWIGIYQLLDLNGTVVAFGAALNCFEFCRYKSGKTKLIVDDTNVKIADSNDLSNSIPLCVKNREGLLCSQCITGYSAVFGSSECKQCSNWWLLGLIVYVAAGPLVIYLLYALKLTLTTGTLNGIIFCIQIFGFFNPPSINLKEMNWLVSGWIHTQLSHPLCLYNGMTELWKQGLSTVYQIYVLSILLGIILLSRFSVRISNKIANSSIQILVTVVHISFSYLLTSIMDVFTPVTVYTNNTEEPMQVWFKYPTAKYGKGSHLVLMIFTSLVVGPILGVYMTVLLAGRPLMRINYRIREYIRPVYEAIHAPYKRNKEFFFVSRLLIVLLLYVIYDFREKGALLGIAIASPILFVYIAVESLARPFKRMSLNIFNVFLLSFSALVYGSSWYFMKSEDEYGLMIIMAIYNAAVVTSLLGVIIIHFLWVTGFLEKIKIKVMKCWSRLSQQNQEEAARVDMSGSFFEPYDRVREPLLSSRSVQYH